MGKAALSNSRDTTSRIAPASERDQLSANETAVPRLLVDLTAYDPQLRLQFRPELTADAALLVADRWKLALKRGVDLIGGSLLIALLIPLLMTVALAVKLSSPGPVFFAQRRAGKDGAEFRFYKFRTMRTGAETERDDFLHLNESTGPTFKIKEDPRFTRVGKLLRRTSIDELPQLWNVVRGEMSLVGPRPLPVKEAAECSEWEAQRLRAKPGITCIWQVSGRSDLDFDTWVRMDIEYIERWCLWSDLKLLFKTIPAVLSGRGAY